MYIKILLFAFITASFTFAQAPGTLYQDDQGNLYRAVHQTTENSAVDSDGNANTVVQNQNLVAVDLTYNSGADSIAYYQNLITRYNASGNKLRTAGNILLGVGIPSTVLGLVLYVVGITNAVQESSNNNYYDDNEMSEGSAVMIMSGSAIMTLGITAITVSIPLKIVGSSKLRNGKRQQQNLNNYKIRNNIAINILPGYNPIEKQSSLNLAFHF